MEYFVNSAKFVPLKYYTLSSQLRRLTSFSDGLFGSANSVTRSYPLMRKSCIEFESIGLKTSIYSAQCYVVTAYQPWAKLLLSVARLTPSTTLNSTLKIKIFSNVKFGADFMKTSHILPITA